MNASTGWLPIQTHHSGPRRLAKSYLVRNFHSLPSSGFTGAPSPRSATRVVLAAPDPILGEVPRAVVALKPGAEVSAEALLAFLRPALATFKLPRSIAFVTAVPRSASGKALRRLL